MRDHTVGRAVHPDAAGERARIDTGNADAAVGFQPCVEVLRRAEIGRLGDVLAQHAAKRMGIERLYVIGIRSEEHTSELQSLMRISYAVFCLKKKKKQLNTDMTLTQIA